MPDQKITQLLGALGELYGIAGLRPDADGLCQLVFGADSIVYLIYRPQNQTLVVSVLLAEHGIENHEALAMARANFLQAGGGVIYCTDSGGRPHAQLQAAPDLGARELHAKIEALRQQASSWRAPQTSRAPLFMGTV